MSTLWGRLGEATVVTSTAVSYSDAHFMPTGWYLFWQTDYFFCFRVFVRPGRIDQCIMGIVVVLKANPLKGAVQQNIGALFNMFWPATVLRIKLNVVLNLNMSNNRGYKVIYSHSLCSIMLFSAWVKYWNWMLDYKIQC